MAGEGRGAGANATIASAITFSREVRAPIWDVAESGLKPPCGTHVKWTLPFHQKI